MKNGYEWELVKEYPSYPDKVNNSRRGPCRKTGYEKEISERI